MKLALLLLLCLEKVRSDDIFDYLHNEIDKLLSGKEIDTLDEIKKTFLGPNHEKNQSDLSDNASVNNSENHEKRLKELNNQTLGRTEEKTKENTSSVAVTQNNANVNQTELASKPENKSIFNTNKSNSKSMRDMDFVEGLRSDTKPKMKESTSVSNFAKLDKQLYVLLSFASQTPMQKVDTLYSFMDALNETFIVAKNGENNHVVCENNDNVIASEPRISYPNSMPVHEFTSIVSDILNSEVIVISKSGSGIEISTGLKAPSRAVQEEKETEKEETRELNFNGAKYEKTPTVPVAKCLIEKPEEGEPAFFPLSNLEFYQRIGDSDATSLIIKIVKDAALPPIGKTLYLSINSGASNDIKIPLISLVTVFGSNAADVKVEIDEDAILFAIPVVEDTPDLIINVFNLATVNKAEYTMLNQSNILSMLSSDLLSSNPYINYYTNACNFLPPNFDLPTTQEIAMNLLLEKMKSNARRIEVDEDEINKMAISSFITEMRSKLGNKEMFAMKPDSFFNFCKSVTSCVSSIADAECKKDWNTTDIHSGVNVELSLDISVMFKDYLTHTDFSPVGNLVPTECNNSNTDVSSVKTSPKSNTKKVVRANVKQETKSQISGSYYVAGGVVVAVCAVLIYTFVF